MDKDLIKIAEKTLNMLEKKSWKSISLNNILDKSNAKKKKFEKNDNQIEVIESLADFIKNKENFFRDQKLKYSFFYNNISNAHKSVDCVMTDTWISMGEKKNLNKKNILKKYQVNDKIMNQVNKKAIFMHCLPAHRNEEVADSVIDGNQSRVFLQAKNRMFVQQSILYFLTNNV